MGQPLSRAFRSLRRSLSLSLAPAAVCPNRPPQPPATTTVEEFHACGTRSVEQEAPCSPVPPRVTASLPNANRRPALRERVRRPPGIKARASFVCNLYGRGSAPRPSLPVHLHRGPSESTVCSARVHHRFRHCPCRRKSEARAPACLHLSQLRPVVGYTHFGHWRLAATS